MASCTGRPTNSWRAAMPTLDEIVASYNTDLLAGDPVRAEVARRHLDRLPRTASSGSSSASSTDPSRRSRWAHVPLGTLFSEVGNRLHDRARGMLETGHEPFHSS